MFNSLGKNVVYKILDKIILEINNRLKNRGIIVSLSEEAKNMIINESYDESFGARPIKRYVSDNIETLVAMRLIDGKMSDNSNILVDVNGDKHFYIRDI